MRTRNLNHLGSVRTVIVYSIDFDQVFELESELPVSDDVLGLFVENIVLGECVIVGEL